MKLLTPDQLVELLPADPEKLAGALDRFVSLTPTLFREPRSVHRHIAEGWTTPVQINVDGKAAYIVTWRRTDDGGMWIDIAQAVSADAPFDALVNACERLALKQGCRYLRFATARRGLVRLGEMFGYTPEAVLMGKGLRP